MFAQDGEEYEVEVENFESCRNLWKDYLAYLLDSIPELKV